MTIEQIAIGYLATQFNIPVVAEVPENEPAEYIVVEKTGGGIVNRIRNATLAIKSVSTSLLDAAELNDAVVAAMQEIVTLDTVMKCELNSDYNYTDTRTKRYRYQAVFDLIY